MDEFLKEDDVQQEIEVEGDNTTQDQEDDDVTGNDDIGIEDQEIGDEHEDTAAPLTTFKEHKEPVLSISVAKNGQFAISGGQDDTAHVWDIQTGQKHFTCHGHTDSVIGVGVNCNDTMVASADMNGLIQVWQIPSGDKTFDYEVDDILWLSWHPVSLIVLLVGTQSGGVWIFNVQDSSKMKILESGSSGCTSGRITRCGNKLMAGYEDGSLRFWDLKTCSIIHAMKDRLSHESSVTCIDFRGEEDSIAASGSTDGTVKMTHLSSGRILTSLVCGRVPGVIRQEREDDDSVESVLFSSSLPVIASSTVKGVIEVWEVSNFSRRCYFLHEEGVSCILWDPFETFKLYSAGLDGCVSVWDARNGKILSRIHAHEDQILDMKIFSLSNDSNQQLLLTASEDTTCQVLSTDFE